VELDIFVIIIHETLYLHSAFYTRYVSLVFARKRLVHLVVRNLAWHLGVMHGRVGKTVASHQHLLIVATNVAVERLVLHRDVCLMRT
jgi:hypothetical protein